MPRLLVTGGAGFIGSHIVDLALQRGWQVRVADSFRPDVNFDDAPDYVHSNETGTATVLAAMARAGVDCLVLASSMVVYGDGGYRDAYGPVSAPPRAVADLEAGRFDPVSPRTGRALQPVLITENAPLDPRNVYAATKLQQEQERHHRCSHAGSPERLRTRGRANAVAGPMATEGAEQPCTWAAPAGVAPRCG